MLVAQTILAGGGVRSLLLALVAALAAVAAMSLAADAQTLDDESGQADQVQGRIFARIHDRPAGGVGDYRIEFGFFPEWALRQPDFTDRVAGAWSSWLPRSRFVAKRVIDQRAANDDRRWLRSSLITVPAQPPGGDGSEITGRVIARYNPDLQGDLRVEFGFLPESAFTAAAGTEQAVAQFGEQFLPRSRYLGASLIANRRGVWFRSSIVNLSSLSSSTGGAETLRPVVGPITCSPSSLSAGDATTCTASITGGQPTSWSWSGGDSIGRSATYRTSFSAAGVHTVSLSVSNSVGSDRGETTVNVQGPISGRPEIWRINCDPPLPHKDENVTCTAEIRGGAPTSWTWSSKGRGAGDSAVYRTIFDSPGYHRINLRVSNESGRDDHYKMIRVIWPTNTNTLELVGRISAVAVNVNGSERVDVNRYFRDRAGNGLSFTLKSDNSAVDVHENNGIITVTGHREGSATITVRAVNSYGAWAIQTFRVTVNPRPVEETACAPIAPLTVDEGASERVNVRCDGRNVLIRAASDSDSVATVSVAGNQLIVRGESAGRARITVSATGERGTDSVNFNVTVNRAQTTVAAPSINKIWCPETSLIGQPVTCIADLRGDAPTSWEWAGGESRGTEATFRTIFSSPGDKSVSLTVGNAGGSNSRSVIVHVTANVAPAPASNYAWCGSEKVWWFNRQTSTRHWIKVTGEQATAVFGLPWWDTVVPMSKIDCDTWEEGRPLTMPDLPPR